MLLMKWQPSKIFQAFLEFLIHDYSNFNHCSIDFILDWCIHPRNDENRSNTQIDWMLCVLSRLLVVKALVASMRRSGWSCLSGSGEIRLYPELWKKGLPTRKVFGFVHVEHVWLLLFVLWILCDPLAQAPVFIPRSAAADLDAGSPGKDAAETASSSVQGQNLNSAPQNVIQPWHNLFLF